MKTENLNCEKKFLNCEGKNMNYDKSQLMRRKTI